MRRGDPGTSKMSVGRALDDAIERLSQVEATPAVRSLLGIGRQLRMVMETWTANPPDASTEAEIISKAMRFAAHVTSSPPTGPTSVPDGLEPPARSTRTPRATLGRVATATGLSPVGRAAPAAAWPQGRAAIAPGITIARPDLLEWRPLRSLPGGAVRLLHRGADGRCSARWQLAAGAELPRHRHADTEDMLVLEGTLLVQGNELRAGDACHAEPGSVHDALLSRSGCVVFIVGSERDDPLSGPGGRRESMPSLEPPSPRRG